MASEAIYFKAPHLKIQIALENLPTEYTYLLEVNDENFLKFRIKEVTDESSVKKWIAKLSEYTKTTWRTARTYPGPGKCNIYKVDLRCQHATDKRVQGSRTSKNTDCPASLTVIVKRYIKSSRSKKKDSLIKDWPTICKFKYIHNHEIHSAAALQHRDLCEESREFLCSLFRKGHGPTSALRCLKTDLMLRYGDEYLKIAGDGFYIPTLSVTTKLFHKKFSARNRVSADWFTPLKETRKNMTDEAQINPTTESDPINSPIESILPSADEEVLSQSMENGSTQVESEILTDEEIREFDILIKRIKDGCRDDPKIFAPAIRKMLKNSKRYAATQSGLISALCTFGSYSGAGKRRHHGQKIGVQPTSIIRRKSFLSGKRKLSAGRPSNNNTKRPKGS